MFFRRIQIMLMALIAVSALQQSAKHSESLQVALEAKRLAKTQEQVLVSVPDEASSAIALVSKKPNRIPKTPPFLGRSLLRSGLAH